MAPVATMLQVTNDTIPLRLDEHGVLRVGATRVRFQSVLAAFERGATPEGIVQSFPALELGEVYAVLGYYLRHRADVNAHVEKERAEAERTRREIEAESPQEGIRDRLLKRQKEPDDPGC